MKRKTIFIVTLAIFSIVNAGECGWCQTLSLTAGTNVNPTTLRFKWSQGEAETNKVDILFAFDSSAKNWLVENGYADETFSREVISEMNDGISLTGLNEYFTFRLAGLYTIMTNLSGLSMSDVCKYSSGVKYNKNYEAYFEPMRECRDDVAADIVVVFTGPTSSSIKGISPEMDASCFSQSAMRYMADHAYCAVDISTTFMRHTVLHEIGHIFGAGHSNTQKSDPGPQLFYYSAGYGYITGGKKYATVMTYVTADEEGNLTPIRLPFFSSPNFFHGDIPVGTVGKNDNTRTLRETYSFVANFRVKTYLPNYNQMGDATNDDNLGSNDISLIVRDDNGEVIGTGDKVNLYQFENVLFSIQAECWTGEKATVKVTGLPTGMKYSSKTENIVGYPKKTGTFAVKVTAKAKGMSESVRMFSISVSALPNDIVGSFTGIISNGVDSDVLAAATLYKTGRVVVKFNHAGRNRTFSCYGFSNANDSWWFAMPSAKINNATHSLNVIFDVARRSVSIEGYTGELLQNPWGRKDIVAPIFKKALQRNFGDFTMRLYGKGKAKLTMSIGGKKTSGVFQLVAGTPEEGYKGRTWALPAAFPPKRNFLGWTGWFVVDLVVDSSNRVTDASVEKLENL